MNALRALAIRINAILILVVAGLLLSLTLAWRLHEVRHMAGFEEQDFAAELLAHGLPQQAVEVLAKAIEREPLSTRGLQLRKALAEILMDRLGDYEKALTELVFVQTYGGDLASGTETGIRHCMHRLGRVYDIQRRMILEKGDNPLAFQVASDSVIRLGKEAVLSVDQLRHRLAQLGISAKDLDKDTLDRAVQGIAGEILLRRAAKRSGVTHESEFLAQVREFEENLALQKYLETEVLKDVKVDPQALALYLQQHAAEFDSPLRVVFSQLSFSDPESARAFMAGQDPATAPTVLVDQRNSLLEELPMSLRSIPWEKEPVKGMLGPIDQNGTWMVFQVHEVIPPRRVPPQLAQQQAQLKLLEQKKAGRFSEKIAELARQEELLILEETLKQAFPGIASAPGKPQE